MKDNIKKPPRIAEWLLSRTLGKQDRDIVLGDFEEFYIEFFNESGALKASTWYWMQTIKSIPAIINNTLYWNAVMFKNYVKIALRNMQKQKLFSFINISGLAIGIACCLLVLLFIQHELSYDMFHENVDRIYKVGTQMGVRDRWVRWPNFESATQVGPAMVDEFPEVVNTVRVTSDVAKKVLFRDKDNSFYEEGFYAADPNFFEFFDFPLVSGDPKTVLDDPHAIVITEEIAQKYFGREDPIGKTFSATGYRGRNQINYELTVTGVMKNIPENSHLQFNILGSLLGGKSVYDLLNWDSWAVASLYTYILLREDSSPIELESKLSAFFEKNMTRKAPYEQRLFIEPLSAVHRTPEVTRYIYVIFAIALVILLIACINFTNLSTARSLTRAKEIGIRKVVGANRFQLIKQFIGESVLFSLCALVIALLLAKLLLPVFNTLVGKNMELEIFRDPLFIAASVGIALFVGVLSGSYPALFISAFKPVSVFKGQSKSGSRRYHFKNILVVFQYAVSVFFIIGTIITYSQMHFILHKDLGFDKEQILNISLSEKLSKDQLETIKYIIAKNQDIANVTYSSSLPFSGRLILFAFPEEVTEPDLKKEILMDVIYCDYDFIETLGIEIIEGRDFSREHPSDLTEAFIINKPAAEAYNLESPLGRKIKYAETGGFGIGTVIGIMKNFHNESFHRHREIRPMVLAIKPPQFNDYYKFISVKLRPGKIPETIEFLRKTMLTFSQDDPFEYSFFDERINALYESEQRLMTLFIVVSFMAIFIACLGLFGLAAFSAERRTKEIGIRKVLGASVAGIVTLLSKQFIKCVIVANIIAWPVAYLVMRSWLQNFAYRIDIGWKTFALAGFTTLLIALITIGAQVIKAATANPIDSLRYE